jgi:hypothetical protein
LGRRKAKIGVAHTARNCLRKILEDLTNAPSGSAVSVPLEETGGTSLANLRSAVNRATRAKGLRVETQSDEKYFYVWKS